MRPSRALTTTLTCLAITSSGLLGCASAMLDEPEDGDRCAHHQDEAPPAGCVGRVLADDVEDPEATETTDDKEPLVREPASPPEGPPVGQPGEPPTEPPDPELGNPIEATAGPWMWVDFPDSTCANGTSTGIAVNLSPSNGPVLIYLEGGGSCVDEQSCWIEPTAVNMASGYGQQDFNASAMGGGFFDRGDVDNPFRNASYVYVPYCTGDAHMGSNTPVYGSTTTHHSGYDNLGAFLARVVPTFPSATRVYLAGSSAGGYGAAYNWHRTQQMFGSIAVDLINDSGPWLPAPHLSESREQTWRSAWNLDANWPAGCSECLDDLDAIYSFTAQQFPASRGALLSHVSDTIIASVFGLDGPGMAGALAALMIKRFKPHANLQGFIVAGDGHVLWNAPQTQHGDTTLMQWLTLMVDHDAGWTTVTP